MTGARAILAGAFVAAALLSACAHEAPDAESTESTLEARGRTIAETYCASCHAIGASGESRNPEAPPLRTLAERYPVTALEEAFAEGVLVGHPMMPEFQFSPDDIDALLAYLGAIQERQGG